MISISPALIPASGADHYASPLNAARFDVQSEQRHASGEGTIPADVASEIALLDRADLVILQYLMWWHLPPAMLKGWLDRVFIYGEVYTSAKRFEDGRFAGRRAMLSASLWACRRQPVEVQANYSTYRSSDAHRSLCSALTLLGTRFFRSWRDP